MFGLSLNIFTVILYVYKLSITNIYYINRYKVYIRYMFYICTVKDDEITTKFKRYISLF